MCKNSLILCFGVVFCGVVCVDVIMFCDFDSTCEQLFNKTPSTVYKIKNMSWNSDEFQIQDPYVCSV